MEKKSENSNSSLPDFEKIKILCTKRVIITYIETKLLINYMRYFDIYYSVVMQFQDNNPNSITWVLKIVATRTVPF